MNIALWTVQIVLAVTFLWSGTVKARQPIGQLVASGQTGVGVFPAPVVRFTAVCELLAAAGLILPWATGIATFLTPAAAGGLILVMIGALFAHSTLLAADRKAGRGTKELRNVLTNLTIMAMSIFVLVGRA